MKYITSTIAAASLLCIAGAANASCLNNGTKGFPPAVLAPQPGEIYGCPVYSRILNGRFWFSNLVEPNFDNHLYGFELHTTITGTVTKDGTINATVNGNGKNNLANLIDNLVTQNNGLTQFGNMFGSDIALLGVTFTPTDQTFESPDGTVIVIVGDIRQGL